MHMHMANGRKRLGKSAVTAHKQSIEYRGEHIALLTKHGKEQVIAPRFAAALGACVTLVESYDTDQFGTFTRDIPRNGTQLDAARRKARKGMELTGLPLGVASEGAFCADPFAGMFPWNIELVLLIDDRINIEVCGIAQAPAHQHHGTFSTREALDEFARKAAFPEHFLIVRPEREDDRRIRKDLCDWASLHQSFAWAKLQSSNGQVFVESDLRAHANPSRMHNICTATEDLIDRIKSRCPSCIAPGFSVVERIAGLPCEFCGAPTRETRAEQFACLLCAHQEIRNRAGLKQADASACNFCNP